MSKTKKIFILILICILLIGTGVGVFVAISAKRDKVEENGELVYVVDRYADEYGSFTVKINQNGDVFDVSVYVDGEQYVDYELVYNKDTNVFTSEDDVVLDGVELVDGCEIVKATVKNDDAGLVSKDEFKPVGMNYGKNFVIEATENDEYKVVYLDLGGKNEGNGIMADNSGKDNDTTEVTTEEETTTEKKSEDKKEESGDNDRDESDKETDNSNSSYNTPSNPNNGNSENSNSGNNNGGNGGGNTTQVPSTEAPFTEAPSTEAPSTEAPSTEYVCEHDWVEEMGTRNVFSHCVQVCKYCGFETKDLDEIIHHVMGCGGIWTHEDLKDSDPFAYNALIGRPKGSNYCSEERYIKETYVVGYRCKKCGEFKYAD